MVYEIHLQRAITGDTGLDVIKKPGYSIRAFSPQP